MRSEARATEGGAYVSIRDLLGLRVHARGISLLPNQPRQSQLAGLQASRLRGRGLEFEELRAYQPGDDIRDIDWKVTARMRKPHTRVYTEERDRKALLLVDQRINMFFGSRVQMKSVTAAQAAALCAWRILDQGDRPGAIVFNDVELSEIPPHRSRARSMAVFNEIVRFNRALHAEVAQRSNPSQLNRVLERAARLANHDHLIVLVSDLDGMDSETPKLLNRLTQHNDVVVVLAFDPLERDLPNASLLVVSDGELQIEFDARDERLRAGFSDAFSARVDFGRKELHKRSVPMLPISTAEPVASQIRALLGKRS
jgi:uncharacterized protein (DUF58 family)